MRLFLTCCFVAATCATASHAADVVVMPDATPAPVYQAPQTFSWRGAYFGGLGGYQWTEAEPNTFRIRQSRLYSNGGIVGAFAGYNYQFENNLVLGLEGELDYNFGAKDQDLDVLLNGAYQPLDGKLDLQWGGSVRARLGYAFDHTLLYATGGWEIVGARLKASGPMGNIDTDDTAFNGWTVGAGAEYAFTDNLFGRLEYRYSYFPKVDHPFGFDEDFSVTSSQNRVLVGMGYKF